MPLVVVVIILAWDVLTLKRRLKKKWAKEDARLEEELRRLTKLQGKIASTKPQRTLEKIEKLKRQRLEEWWEALR